MNRTIFILFILSTVLPVQSFAASTGIVARVNDDIISDRDFTQRLKFIEVAKLDDVSNTEVRDRLLKQMIDEKLKNQEAKNANVSVDDAEVLNAAKMAMQQNGMKYNDISNLLKKNGLPFSVITDQVKSDLLFVRAIRKKAGTERAIDDREVEAKIAEYKKKAEKTHYLISEIVLPFKSQDDEAKTYGKAMKMLMDMRDGKATFEKLAKTKSKSPTAAKGGFAGWMDEDSFSPEEKEELTVLQVGQVSTPIRNETNYKLILLRSIQPPTDLTERDAVHVVQLFLPAFMNEKKKNNVIKESNMTRGNCELFTKLSLQQQTTPKVDLGMVPVTELPPPIAKLLNKTELLTPTAPLDIDGGKLVLMFCDKGKIVPLPSKEQIKTQMESERLESYAGRRLRELRRLAVTEIRK